MFEVALEIALLLVLAGFVAGFVDAIAGGGGLITVPALLLAGATPVEALATNKLQGSFGSGTSTLAFARAGHVNVKEQLPLALISFVASAAGATVAHLMPADALRIIMPVILILVAGFFAFRKGLSDEASRARLSPLVFSFTAVPLIAAYDGFFGPGTGSFFMMAFVLLAGYGMMRATAHTKLLNFAANIGALAVFVQTGSTWWMVGLGMACGQTLGALIGAKLAMRIGARLIRPLLIFTSSAMALRLIYQALAS